MDFQSAGSVAGIVSLIIVIGGRILDVINNKRIRSNCCGKIGEASLNIENTTPPFKISVPDSTIPKEELVIKK